MYSFYSPTQIPLHVLSAYHLPSPIHKARMNPLGMEEGVSFEYGQSPDDLGSLHHGKSRRRMEKKVYHTIAPHGGGKKLEGWWNAHMLLL